VWQDHYEAQAVVACFIDSDLNGQVHWGHSTHWKLRLLMSPFIFPLYLWDAAKLPQSSSASSSSLSSSSSSSSSPDKSNAGEDVIELTGPENAWGIVSFPTKIGLKQNRCILRNETTIPSSSSSSLLPVKPDIVKFEDEEVKFSDCEVVEGMATPQHAHIDGGRAGCLNELGVPPKNRRVCAAPPTPTTHFKEEKEDQVVVVEQGEKRRVEEV
jgi:hypothetical protein